MEENQTTFEIIMSNCPFLKSLIQDKIVEEIATKDVEISALAEENDKLKVRLDATDRISADSCATQQELIEALIEAEVI